MGLNFKIDLLQTRLISIIVFFTLLTPCSGAAEIYRWKNGQGQIHYSSSPPSYPVAGLIEVKRNNRWYPYTGQETFSNLTANPANQITYTTSFPNQELPLEKAAQQTVIPYSQYQSMIIVDVTLNRNITRPFAVDTGATYTVISQELANRLHIHPTSATPQITLQTANGRIQVPLVTLDSLSVNGLESANITAAIHQFDESSMISGLLGLNFLNRFQMTVNARENQLIFIPIARDCVAAKEQIDLGQALRNNSEQEAAYYRKALMLCPDLVDAYYFLGVVYIHQQDAQRAIDIHRQLLRKLPHEAEVYFRLGVSYLLQRDFQQAESQFQKALELDATHQQAREYLERLKNL
ncbi:CTPR390 protein [Candidatus Vecturithrix granuli]|uniref:CTPR390 protein n=1 Tax=Vecturithrix granuli TaxID=1499967 RepID=A0A0S6W586_VECG1|nr:CTPR390 protein [Candidatus Vecturithrix granuli]